MANMNSIDPAPQETLSEQEIDQIVETQANNDSAWENPIIVQKHPTSLSIPSELAVKATFLAGLHQETNVQAWIIRLIRERLELEEAAYLEIKQNLAREFSK
jgi:hypothetical protein